MFFSILFILNADKKVLEINDKVEKFKKTDFQTLQKTVSVFKKINKYVRLDKIKKYTEIAMTVFSVINLYLLLKKISNKISK